MQAFVHALLFFTRLPLPKTLKPWLEKSNVQKFVYFFSLSGVAVGGTQFLITWFFSSFVPMLLSICLGIAFTIFFTGALHEDGLADFFDGFGAGKNREDILRIMKDSQVGVYGILALILSLLLRIFLWQEVLLAHAILFWFLLLILSHSLAKTIMLLPMCFLDYARGEESKIKNLITKVNASVLFFNFLFPSIVVAILCYMGNPSTYLLSFFAVILFSVFFVFFLKGKVGGYTGDTLGALAQLGEITFLLALVFFK